MNIFWNFVSVIGGTTALIACAAFLAKALSQHWLTKDLEDYKLHLLRDSDKYRNQLALEVETHKAQLARMNAEALDRAKFEFEKELISRRGQMDLFRDEIKYINESEQQRQARLQTQIQRWANPIRVAIGDLEHRLSNILSDGGNVALVRGQTIPPNWSADYNYFMASTLYYFAQYFCWTQLLQHQLGYELFGSTTQMASFWQSIQKVSDELSRFPYQVVAPEDDANGFADRQVFRLQQRAIGELLVDRTGSSDQIVSYREFLDRWLDPTDVKLKQHVAPLENFLADLVPNGDIRWIRLEGMLNQLQDFRNKCSQVLTTP